MITSIVLDNFFSREAAEEKAAKLQEITRDNFHDFKYKVCPIGGSMDLMAETHYNFTDENGEPLPLEQRKTEMLETFVYILTNQI